MTREGDGYRLVTGRYLYANNGILGLAPGGRLHEGYDGSVIEDLPDVDTEYFDPLTLAERIEISRFMVDVWRAWADDHGPMT